MKRMSCFLFLTLLMLSLIICCQKKSTFPDKVELPDFPNTIGSRFVYFFFDSLSMTSDTVVVSIVDTTTFDDDQRATVWEYTWSSRVDTEYAWRSGDSVRISSAPGVLWRSTTYILPLEVGNGWRSRAYGSDTSTVIEQVSVSVPAGEFHNAFLIERWRGELNAYEFLWTWFVPKVGVVQKHRRGMEGTWGVGNETWELVEYHIARGE